jgi:HD-GYP domain-containing protein (c-di-GMP phosphodiesterase class II)
MWAETMEEYISIKKSQADHYIKTPLYIKNRAGGFVLYKPENKKVDSKRFLDEGFPPLFISVSTHESAKEELEVQLKQKLRKEIKSGNLGLIKSAICEIVQEALQEPVENNLDTLPETIEILYSEYTNTKNLLKNYTDTISGRGSLIEHSVDVMVLSLNYCLFCNFSENDTRRVSLGALLHDVGLTQIPKAIAEADRKLTDQEFIVYKTHAAIGHDIIKQVGGIDPAISTGVLEHHERLDGNGYPRGIAHLSFEGRLIGLIDSFDNLISSEKVHRKKKKPFEAMQTIQNEVLKEAKFDKKIFREFCLSLSDKFRLD